MKKHLVLFLLLCVSMTALAQNDYDTQRGIELYNQENYSSALPYLQRAAKAGSLPALDFLGSMYANGYGVEKDPQVAINLYKKAIAKNYAPCMVSMGALYENGIGVAKNPETAYSYYKKAADLGYGGGEFEVSLCKKYGFGTTQSPEEAFQYALKAANHGWRYEYLGDMYYEGYGTEVNYSKAYEWYTKDNCEYSDKAQLRAAIMQGTGQGVTKNALRAMSILDKLKQKSTTVEGFDEWYRKIKALSNEEYALLAAAEERSQREANKVTVPQFNDAVRQYIKRYPEPSRPAIESAGRGEIVIACTISAGGYVKNARIKYRVLQRLDNAALDLVNNMPRLTPGTKGGRVADINVEIGVRFFPTSVRITKYYR